MLIFLQVESETPLKSTVGRTLN